MASIDRDKVQAAAQNYASKKRYDKAIADYLKDPAKPEGSISQRTEGCKVTVTYKLDRKVNSDALTKAWDSLSAGAQATFKWSPSVSVSELRKLGPADAAAVSRLIAQTCDPGAGRWAKRAASTSVRRRWMRASLPTLTAVRQRLARPCGWPAK